MTKLAVFLALLATPQLAAAQAQACLTRQEVSNLFMFAAPALIEAAARKCGATLPADAFLRTGTPQLVQRLRSEAPVDAAALSATFGKFAGRPLPSEVSAETIQSMVRDVVTARFANDIKIKDCGKIDALTAALAPLPARNLGSLITTLMELGTGDKPGPFKFCPAARP